MQLFYNLGMNFADIQKSVAVQLLEQTYFSLQPKTRNERFVLTTNDLLEKLRAITSFFATNKTFIELNLIALLVLDHNKHLQHAVYKFIKNNIKRIDIDFHKELKACIKEYLEKTFSNNEFTEAFENHLIYLNKYPEEIREYFVYFLCSLYAAAQPELTEYTREEKIIINPYLTWKIISEETYDNFARHVEQLKIYENLRANDTLKKAIKGMSEPAKAPDIDMSAFMSKDEIMQDLEDRQKFNAFRFNCYGRGITDEEEIKRLYKSKGNWRY